jgi:hypothetical protein
MTNHGVQALSDATRIGVTEIICGETRTSCAREHRRDADADHFHASR